MIPWVVALVVVSAGLAALVPDVFGAKCESHAESHGEVAAELTDHAQPLARQSHASDHLAPPAGETAVLLNLISCLACIETDNDQTTVKFLRHLVRGRAPPVGSLI